MTALAGNRDRVHCAAAKGGTNSATNSLALEAASRGLTVNAIEPGIIHSLMAASAFDAEAIKRMVAVMAGFLASPAAGYIIGQVTSVNGG